MSCVELTMKTLIVLAAFVFGAQSVSYTDSYKNQWENFKLTHGKQYSSVVEEEFRMKIFIENQHMIETHNKKYELGLVSYYLGMNKFGDLLLHEILDNYTGWKKQSKNGIRKNSLKRVTFTEPEDGVLPDSVDWRKKGAVTPVKDQYDCGSCWCFSATGSLEGQHFIKTGKLVSLSEQNLIDCTRNAKYKMEGCKGGNEEVAFQYIADNKGIDTEASYPYEGEDDTCRFNASTVGTTISGFVNIPSGSEAKLQVAVTKIGPISVAIDASQPSFVYYEGDFYDEPQCGTAVEDLNHAVLIVGYGRTEDGEDYWLVKNSWGSDWGEQGYILMSRNNDNQCGIATEASYPLI